MNTQETINVINKFYLRRQLHPDLEKLARSMALEGWYLPKTIRQDALDGSAYVTEYDPTTESMLFLDLNPEFGVNFTLESCYVVYLSNGKRHGLDRVLLGLSTYYDHQHLLIKQMIDQPMRKSIAESLYEEIIKKNL